MQNRREFLAAGAASVMTAAGQGEPPVTLDNATYQHIKGFNYVPSYAATIWDVIDLFDEATWDREFSYSKRYRSNALRIWCDYLSYQRDASHFLKAWERALALAEKHDLRLMITTANRWVDARWQYGQVDLAVILRGVSEEYKNYLRSFVGAFRQHPRVLMWDLCNEPFFWTGNRAEDVGMLRELLKRRELEFWKVAVDTARSAQPSQPITVGIHGGHDRNPEEIYGLVDVISCHPYGGWWDNAKGFQETCDTYIRIANRLRKPLICSETCQGSKSNQTRTRIIETSIRELERRKIGWLAWQLMAGKIVTARWDRTDTNCRPGDESVMYWIEKDGSVRPGHEESAWRTKG